MPNVKRRATYAALLDHLSLTEVFVLGISAGEWSTLQFGIRHPQRCRALVLIVPANYLPPNKRNYGGPLVRFMVSSNFATWAAVRLTSLMPGTMTGTTLGTSPVVVRTAAPSERERVQQILEDLLPVTQREGGMQFDIKTAHHPGVVCHRKNCLSCPND